MVKLAKENLDVFCESTESPKYEYQPTCCELVSSGKLLNFPHAKCQESFQHTVIMSSYTVVSSWKVCIMF